MAYNGDRRPPEYASKVAHSHIIKDQAVIDFLKRPFWDRLINNLFPCILTIRMFDG